MAESLRLPRQDMPPPGGFEAIRYKRHLPNRGFPGYVFFLAGAAAIGFGLYKVGDGNHKNAQIKRERVEARIAIVPLLLAEEDRRYLKWKDSNDREEADLLKHLPGLKAGERAYHSERWVTPAQVNGA